MANTELNDVAWDLVEHCRPVLSIADLNTAFVRLGVGEYSEAMAISLKSVVRAGGPPLPERLLGRLRQLLQVYYFDTDFAGLVTAAAEAG